MSIPLRNQLIRDLSLEFGIVGLPLGDRVLISQSDYDELLAAVLYGPYDAIAKGYYLGAVEYAVQPDWMFDPLAVACARIQALVRKAFKPLLNMGRTQQ